MIICQQSQPSAIDAIMGISLNINVMFVERRIPVSHTENGDHVKIVERQRSVHAVKKNILARNAMVGIYVSIVSIDHLASSVWAVASVPVEKSATHARCAMTQRWLQWTNGSRIASARISNADYSTRIRWSHIATLKIWWHNLIDASMMTAMLNCNIATIAIP